MSAFKRSVGQIKPILPIHMRRAVTNATDVYYTAGYRASINIRKARKFARLWAHKNKKTLTLYLLVDFRRDLFARQMKSTHTLLS